MKNPSNPSNPSHIVTQLLSAPRCGPFGGPDLLQRPLPVPGVQGFGVAAQRRVQGAAEGAGDGLTTVGGQNVTQMGNKKKTNVEVLEVLKFGREILEGLEV